MKISKLTLKQQRFADEYIISGNATESYLKAGYANQSRKSAEANARKLLANYSVKNYIDERLKKIESEKTASQQEVIEYLSSVMRGEHTEQTLIGEGQGVQRITDIDVSAKDRIKAAELLNKIHQVREEKEIQKINTQEDKLDSYINKVDGVLDEHI